MPYVHYVCFIIKTVEHIEEDGHNFITGQIPNHRSRVFRPSRGDEYFFITTSMHYTIILYVLTNVSEFIATGTFHKTYLETEMFIISNLIESA